MSDPPIREYYTWICLRDESAHDDGVSEPEDVELFANQGGDVWGFARLGNDSWVIALVVSAPPNVDELV